MRKAAKWIFGSAAILLAAGLLAGHGLARAQGIPQGPGAVRGSENNIIDYQLSEMLAAWQIGDAALLRSCYTENVTVVSGVYEAPVVGRENFIAAYQQQRARMEKVQVERENTIIAVRGNVAWAAYQWKITAMVDGRGAGFRGHATLVLEKGKDRWLIAHNHTSLVNEPPAAPPQNPGP
jgi:uncharacterized protein (TIGR02246 family)